MKAPALVLLGAVPALAVAAAWWASSGGDDEALRAEVAQLRDRVELLEKREEASRESAREARDEVAQLEERVVEAELRAAPAAPVRPVGDAGKAQEPMSWDGRPPAGGGRGWGAKTDGENRPASAKEKKLADEVINDLDVVSKSLTAQMTGLKAQLAVMKLRQLPEDERWKKAMKDVGLNQNQVDVLRQAIADRDRTYKDVTTTEWRVEDDGTKVGETTTDEAAVAEADRRYESATHGVMTDTQAERWRQLGFSQAFGVSRPKNRVQRYPRKR